MRATVWSVEADFHPLLPGVARVMIDLPYEQTSQIARPDGHRVCLIGPGDAGRSEGIPIGVEGRVIFPRRPEEMTELAVFRPEAAGIEVGTTWEVVPARLDPSDVGGRR